MGLIPEPPKIVRAFDIALTANRVAGPPSSGLCHMVHGILRDLSKAGKIKSVPFGSGKQLGWHLRPASEITEPVIEPVVVEKKPIDSAEVKATVFRFVPNLTNGYGSDKIAELTASALGIECYSNILEDVKAELRRLVLLKRTGARRKGNAVFYVR